MMTLQDLSGQVLGPYQLRQLIGTGGMGAVYRGLQVTLEREVAIKVLSAALAAETGYVERFYREAKTAASLEHAHIIPVYDYGIQRDISYVVMRLLTGGTLAERMRFRQERELGLPSPGEVADLLRQLAGALDYAHSQGVIHRDIKPSNIMFDNQGNTYLVDFGIAKLLGATSALTGTGVAMGTPAYMPPEQWRSDPLTPAADQYALAATVYALLVGHVPYQATTPYGLMHKHFNEMPTPVHTRRPDLPPALTLVIERALAKDPAARFPTVTAFAQAFESAIEGQQGDATGFLTIKLPRRRELSDVATLPLTPGRGTPPPAAPTPEHRPPVPPPPSSEPSMPALPSAGGSSPLYRNPWVGLLALALGVALIVIVFLLTRDGGGATTTPVMMKSPTMVAGGGDLATTTVTPSVTTTALPTKSPTRTASPTPTPTRSSGLVVLSPPHIPMMTHTPMMVHTPRATRTVAPTITPSPSRTPSHTPSHTPTRTPSATPSPSPTLPPTATPEPTEVAGPPVVVIGAAESSLRAGPDSRFEVIDAVSDVELPVEGVSPDGRWYLVTLGDQQGWIHQSSNTDIRGNLDTVPVLDTKTGQPFVSIGRMRAYVREAPEVNAPRLATVSRVALPLLGVTPDGAWYLVEWEDGREGWVRRSGNVRVEGAIEAVPVLEVKAEQPRLRIGRTEVDVRDGPEMNAPRLATVGHVALPLLGVTPDGAWYLVAWGDGREGWVRRSGDVQVEGEIEVVPVIGEVAAEPPMLIVGPARSSLRTGPGGGYEVLDVVSDRTLPIKGVSPDRRWFLVAVGPQQGWIHQSSNTEVQGDLDVAPVVEVEAERPVAIIGPVRTALRVAPAMDEERLAVVDSVRLPVLKRTADGRWVAVEWEGQIAWVHKAFITEIKGNLDAVPVVDATAEAGKTFLDVLLDTDFAGSLEGVVSESEGWRVRREGDESLYCVSYSGGRYGENPFALFELPLRSRDYLVWVTVRFTSETGHFAILTRFADATGAGYRHAIQRHRDGSGSVAQYYVGFEDESLGDVLVTIEPDVWYRLRAEVQGEEIRTYLDNRLMVKAPSEARSFGTVAIEGGPETDVCIGRIVVRSLDQAPDAMRNVPVGVATANLNLRRGPGTEHPVIGHVIDGDMVFVMEKSDDDGWFFVRVERTGQHGWVAAGLVAVQ